MSYGELKIDTITFTAGGVDSSISVSGLVQNPTFTGNLTTTGTISGDIIKGNTISGVNVIGTTEVSGATVTGDVGLFKTITGGVHTLTSGVFASGTAANPSITFVGDLDTGLFTGAANTVSLAASGAAVLTVSGTNVGINTTSPAAANLQVNGQTGTPIISAQGVDNNGDADIRIFSTGSTGSSRIFFSDTAGSNGSIIYRHANDSLAFGTNTNEALRIDSDGRVLIGTTSDTLATSLCLEGNSNTPTAQAILRLALGANNPADGDELGRIAISDSGHGSSVQISAERDGGTWTSGSSMPGRLVFLTTPDGSGSPTARMTIDSEGNVGIGTTDPAAELDIVRTSANAEIHLNSSGGSGKEYQVRSLTNGRFAIGTTTTNHILLIGDDTTLCSSAGNVGIGLTNPSELLHVNQATADGGVLQLTSNWTSIAPLLTFERVGGAVAGELRYNDGLTAMQLGTTTNHNFHLMTNVSNALTINTSQQIGIGTTTIAAGNSLQVGVNGANIAIGGALSANGTGRLKFTTSNSVKNWQISNNDFVAGALEFTPSSAAGGATFSTPAAIFDSSGRFLIGTTSALTNIRRYATNGVAPQLISTATGSWNSGLTLVNYSSLGYSPVLTFGTSLTDTQGTNTLITSGTRMGTVSFNGNSGTNFEEGARIEVQADGTPSSTSMPGRLMFFTTPAGSVNPIEAMRIRENGTVLIGKTTTSVSENGTLIDNNGALFATIPSGNTLHVYSSAASAYRFYVENNGTINATNTTITAISDQRLKENIRDLETGLGEIMALQPRRFDWKTGKGKDIQNDQGFIAQEFEQVFPEMVGEWLDPAPEGEEPYKSVRADLIPVLVKAIQEQQAIINGLEARLAALEAN